MPIYDRSIDTPECQVVRNQRGVCSVPVGVLSSLSTPQDAHRLCFIYTRVSHGGTLARASGKTQNELKGRCVVCVAPVAISELPFLRMPLSQLLGGSVQIKRKAKNSSPARVEKQLNLKGLFKDLVSFQSCLSAPPSCSPFLKHYNQAFIKILR